MNAGDLFDGYRHGAYDPAGVASANACRQVLRELCRVAHDAGIAQISTERLSDRLGLSLSTVKRALKRLKTDGFILRPVRGTGNRQGSEPRQSIWVLRPLVDRSGRALPDHKKIAHGLVTYQQSSRYLRLSSSLRAEVIAAWHQMNTAVQAAPVSTTVDTQPAPKPMPEDRVADLEARKAREQMKIVPPVDKSPEQIQQSVSQTQQSVTTDPHYTSENEFKGSSATATTGQMWPDREQQLAALAAMKDGAEHCPTWRALKAVGT